MTDGVLTGNDAPVREGGGDVVREVADDGGEDGGFGLVDAAHDGEKVDCGLEGSGEEAGAGKEEVAERGGLEVEGRGRGAVALEDLEVQVREDGADEHGLRGRDRVVEGGGAGEEGEEFGGGGGGGGGEAVVEEVEDVEVGLGNQTDEAAWEEGDKQRYVGMDVQAPRV